MSRYPDFPAGFSLVEVTLALGVAAFCLIALLGLLPLGMQTNQSAVSQTAAASILSSVVADLRATARSNPTSPQYDITFGTANNPHKYNRGVLAAWARVVAAVPGSKFAFVRPEGSSPTFRTTSAMMP